MESQILENSWMLGIIGFMVALGFLSVVGTIKKSRK
jgi:hypothetical protein